MSARRSSPPASASSLFTFDIPDAGLDGHVDEANAVIRNVSMITGNLVAKGHDLQVDDTTLRQIFESAQKLGQVPVKLDHGSGILNVNGHLANFRRDGDKVRADWHLLQSHPNTPQMLEIASKQPRTVGLSVTFRGAPEQKPGGTKHARCEDLVSCDLVPHPAANPNGMFSSVDNRSGGMPTAPETNPAAEEGGTDPLQLILGKLQEMDDKFESRLGDIEQFLDANFSGQDTPGDEDGDEDEGSGQMSAGPGDQVTQLEARLSRHIANQFSRQDALRAQAAQEEATLQSFEELKSNHQQLLTLLEAKETELQAQYELLQQLREGGAMAPVAAMHGDSSVTMFSAQPGAELNLFETIVNKKLTELKEKDPDAPEASVRSKAFAFAVNKNPEAYADYRRRQGQSA